MARVLEIVLDFSLQDWQATRGARVRAARDLGAELARAWRICPPVKMRRGHERVTIEPCRFVEAQPNDGGRWQTWIETTAQARRVLAARCRPFVPGVTVREHFDDYRGDVRVATPLADEQAPIAAGSTPVPRDSAAAAHDVLDGGDAPPSRGRASRAAAARTAARAAASTPVAPDADVSGAADASGSSRSSTSGSASESAAESASDSVSAESTAPSAGAVPVGDAVAGTALLGSRSTARPAPDFVVERRRGRWLGADGIEVELTLDDIVFAPAAASSDTIRAVASRVCELRLAVADPDDPDDPDARAAALRALFNAARELSGAWPASLSPISVLDRACAVDAPDANGAPAKAQSVDLSNTRTQRAAFFALGCSVTGQWLGNEAGVRDTAEPEYVHQMRVALRRLRTLARLFPRYADAAWKDAFSGDIRWLAGMLGAVRDWDVCVTSTLPALAAADGDEAAWAGTLDAARAQGDAARAERRLLRAREVHLVRIGREPQRAAVAIRAAFRHRVAQRAPQPDRIMRERELGRVVVHRDHVAHARGRRAAAAVVDDDDAQPAQRELVRARGADDARADHDDVGRRIGHDAMPQPNGSSSSITSVASALRCALPRIVGTTPPSAAA